MKEYYNILCLDRLNKPVEQSLKEILQHPIEN